MPSEQQLLTSLQEQTGIIHVSLASEGSPLNVYGTWMGLSNEDTLQQIEEALAFIGDSPNVAFGGDFNAEYQEPVPQAVVNDATGGLLAVEPQSRIDFVWLRDLKPHAAWVSSSLASDHRMVVVEIEVP